MKKILCAVVTTVLLLTLAFSASAAVKTQTITLARRGTGLQLTVSNDVTVWERPTLRPGEEYTESGTLTIENKTDTEQTITLDHVALPFDNDDALSYLNHVYITVREGETVKYSGTYSRINDENGLVMSYTMPAHSKVELTIDMRCEYTFTGERTGFEGDDMIEWKFYHVATEPIVKQEEKPTAAFSDPALREILIAAGTAVILLIGVGVYEVIRRRRS